MMTYTSKRVGVDHATRIQYFGFFYNGWMKNEIKDHE